MLRYTIHLPRAFLRTYSIGTGWPKPSSRQPLKPYQPQDVDKIINNSHLSEEQTKEIRKLEGWLFGRKVIYLKPKQPFYEVIPDHHKFYFGERPPPPGFKRLMPDWEIMVLTVIFCALLLLFLCYLYVPETDPSVWAREAFILFLNCQCH